MANRDGAELPLWEANGDAANKDDAGFLCNSDDKESACNAGDPSWIPGMGGNDNTLQYSCLKNSMDRGTWVHKESGTTEQITHNRHAQVFLLFFFSQFNSLCWSHCQRQVDGLRILPFQLLLSDCQMLSQCLYTEGFSQNPIELLCLSGL